MSAHMKKRPTEIQVNMGDRVMKFVDVPASKVRPILTLLKNYQDESISWRDLAQDRMKSAGGESAYMVRVARERAELTQVELAKRLKMPQGNISQIETGRRPVGKLLAKRMAKIFNLDYRVFL